jgi:hypothetical protein
MEEEMCMLLIANLDDGCEVLMQCSLRRMLVLSWCGAAAICAQALLHAPVPTLGMTSDAIHIINTSDKGRDI